MDDEKIAEFSAFTSCEDPARAQQYLSISEGNVEQAVSLYFDMGGADIGASAPRPPPMQASGGTAPPIGREIIPVDSDNEDEAMGGGNVEDDEAMARRMQEEIYGSGGQAGADDPEANVRAPIARSAQTLAGPDERDWRTDSDAMNLAITSQMLHREQRRARGNARSGIFNQREPEGSVWDADNDSNGSTLRENLSRATGGASDQSSKSNKLAEMYRPPFELISKLRSWDGVRAEGKELEKWILINIQDPNIFDCQVLNRDIWKNDQIQDTVRENFIFKQYSKTDSEAETYIRYYFQEVGNSDAYPHVAIVDPRTGEQVKAWSGMPFPEAVDFLMQLHEFLDRYSLKANAKNPVARRRAEQKKQKDPSMMTEDEQIEWAMKHSMGGEEGEQSKQHDSDPDSLTRPVDKGKGRADQERSMHQGQQTESSRAQADTSTPPQDSPFHAISSTNPHIEPQATAPNTTRIQFRYPPNKRVIRRFEVNEPVVRIFEWLKSEPLEGYAGAEFELVFMGMNLLGVIDQTIEEAGLKNGSIIIEFPSTDD